jgi:ribosome maturation factor RimP
VRIGYCGRTTAQQEEAVATDRIRDRLADQLVPVLRDLGLDLEAVDLSPAGRRRVLRIAVDKDGGVTLDDVAEATSRISEVLDSSDVMGEQPYTLEVGSRGVDRPLTLPRHWRRNVGRQVRVTARDGSTVLGRLTGADETSATLTVDGSARVVPFADVSRAKVQVEIGKVEG